jgi:hypothetical protein
VWVEGEERVRCDDPACPGVMTYSEYEAAVQRAAGQKGKPGDTAEA